MPTSRAKKAAAEPELDMSGDLEQDVAKVVLSEEEARTALEAKLDALTEQKAGAGGTGSEGAFLCVSFCRFLSLIPSRIYPQVFAGLTQLLSRFFLILIWVS
eukprot:SAG22_NODE_14249_length_380_cov_0.978648_1_plen_102_part_00